MRFALRLTRVLLMAAALAVFVSTIARPLTAQGQAPAAAPAGDPTGATTGTAKDVAGEGCGEPEAGEVMETVGHNKIAINMVWTLIAGFLVMFMQAGFALVETGFTRAKNAAHTMSDELHGLRRSACSASGSAGSRCRWAASAPWPTLGGTPRPQQRIHVHLFGKTFGLFGLKGSS